MRGQLLGSPGSDASGLCRSGSGDRVISSSVPASEEHAEHRSSEDRSRLASLARELDRFKLEGTVRPARRMRVSISCALCRTRPGFPLTLRRLSLLELRVRVEPWGDEVGVKSPDPTAPNKDSLVSGTIGHSDRTWHGVEELAKSPAKLEDSSSLLSWGEHFWDLWHVCKGFKVCRLC